METSWPSVAASMPLITGASGVSVLGKNTRFSHEDPSVLPGLLAFVDGMCIDLNHFSS